MIKSSSIRYAPLFLALLINTTATHALNNQSVMAKEVDNSKVLNYWTSDRLKNATPLPLPQANSKSVKEIPLTELDQNNEDASSGEGDAPDGGIIPNAEQLFSPSQSDLKNRISNPVPNDSGTLNERFSSSQLVPLTADLSYPYTTIGKLFFTIPGQGDYVCSASVIRPRVLLTAGHCVHRGSGGSSGFYTNWLFVPAYRDGAAPFQTWNWRYVITTSTWASGGGSVPNGADYAMLELGDNLFSGSLKRIGNVTGYLGYQTQALIPNHSHLLGYPCNLDNCQKMHQVTAQSARAVSPNNAEYGSDMRGGSSGGPWVQNFGTLAAGQTGGKNAGLNRVVGITSYGYTSTTPMGQGSSIPNNEFITLLNAVCAHKSGNCV